MPSYPTCFFIVLRFSYSLPGGCAEFLGDWHTRKVEESDGHYGHADGQYQVGVVAHLNKSVNRVLKGIFGPMTPILADLDVSEADEEKDGGYEAKESWNNKGATLRYIPISIVVNR